MSYRSWWTAFALALLIAAPAFAQVDQGRFTGTVRDQSNAFVGGAKVKVTNEKTGEERVVLSNLRFFLVGRSTIHVLRFGLNGTASRPSSIRA
jgi:hypothetical protein